MTEHHLTVQRTARYYQLGEFTAQTKRVWFALHGYGQLARYFLRRFDVVQDDETVIIAPEGLSRLYLDAEYGKIGASWITREMRISEVDDYVAYLDAVAERALAGQDVAKLHITLMGFSQGAATACRWLDRSRYVRADQLVLWAGFFPNGLSDVLALDKLAHISVHYVYGEQDEYIEQMFDAAAYLQKLKDELPTLKILPFTGKHVVERAVLARFRANENTASVV